MTAIASPDAHTTAQQLFRGVMGRFATGVTVVTTRVGDEIYGMTANAFMAASLEPMLCVVSINHTAQMHARLLAERHFGVSFLTQEQQHLAAHFAGKRLDTPLVPDFELRGRTPILKRAVAVVTADVLDTAKCGDHTLFIGNVTSLSLGEATRPLLFYAGRYARLDGRPVLDVEPPEFW